MADRFDAFMQNMADGENAAVDFAALKDSVLKENARCNKSRRTLIASLSAAAAFLVIATVGGIALFGPMGATADEAPEEFAVTESAMDQFAMGAEYAADEMTDEAVEEESASEEAPDASGADAGCTTAAVERTAEEAQAMAARLLALSSGTFYDVGLHDAASVEIDGCICTALPCESAVLEPGQLYIAELEGALTGLYQASADEYVLIEFSCSGESAEYLVSELTALP